MSSHNNRVTRQGFTLALIGSIIQRCGSAGFVGYGLAQAFKGSPGWHWWFAGAAVSFIAGSTLMSLAYRHARHIRREDTPHA